MTDTKGKVIYLYQRDPQAALERLNRITGLRFSSWPQSLVSLVTAAERPSVARDEVQPAVEASVNPSERVSG